jgi:small subunit ribosomal protein S21
VIFDRTGPSEPPSSPLHPQPREKQNRCLFGVAARVRNRAGKEVHRLAEIKITDNESIESALRRFKRKVQQEDIIKEIKKHSFYMKPGDKRRAKQALARKRQRKKQRRAQTD